MTSSRNRALSPASVAVLGALSRGISYGFDVMDATGLASGTVYPVLARAERRGLVESKWEDAAISRASGRPARKYYSLTGAGRTALEAGLERYRDMGLLSAEGA